ncbi:MULTISPECIES: aldehyde dehydrogenase family protein [unclassified Sphingobium]|uniref:aldehyde dehydrogenase family protein n=1 Tax=unclassified Sphingobium TaxID=2611147 RepID=UPI00222462BF|nr:MULTISPECIES: aldehyde dehydrogenase family protein [unclassified Sphingobium]MCW2381090.1 acyl-CoA reductase-like NAD-dependent aldehyde dehydrogenase [Sphingobium sp. B2D3B]MCW2398803.1 acyl-CoA reductase-like NAD-dependent aldehyde dehydrogenase [Sphingobium sp. B2D3C]
MGEGTVLERPASVEGADAHLIGGKLVQGAFEDGGRSFAVIDPATGRPFALCPEASQADLDAAVAAARAAFPAWAARTPEDRRARIHTLADSIAAAADRLAPLLTREHGKPIEQARMELTVAAHHMKQLAALEIGDEVLRDDARGKVELRYHPLGVVGAIAPWNFPIALAMHKVAQALYTGNTLILKPSPYTPLTTLAVGALAADVLPAGVMNVLAGGNDLGAWMTAHEGIDKISFTGSVATGKKVMASAAATLKRITLELGGNDATLVLADADLDKAAAGIARSGFYNCGQICMAIKRVYVAEPVRDAFLEKLVEKVRALKVGPGSEPGMDMGPIQNLPQYEKVKAYLEDAVARPGAQLLTGGSASRGARGGAHGEGGYFIEPTIIAGLDESVPLVCEEQFGPVMPVLTFASEDEAVQRANATRFGLGASVWSTDETRARAVAGQLMAGTVWINRHGLNESDVPFGGMKDSGYGREHGVLGIRAYQELQVVSRPVG